LSIGLQLPEIGEIRFDVRIESKTVFIHAFVASERAATALALAISTLRDKLQEHDLVLGRLDVTQEDKKSRGEPPAPDKPRRKGQRSASAKTDQDRIREQLERERGLIHVLA
jgi:flagellar hook-length control protein FliK